MALLLMALPLAGKNCKKKEALTMTIGPIWRKGRGKELKKGEKIGEKVEGKIGRETLFLLNFKPIWK
ncbi:unnamed protein product [Meloidogyne enterolobii]|uniref:Uncharacterized protein n=1 Tax=Meloidogyne enterolobii TaxID=390850 RepID=A0ACB0ZIR0_MELEN